MRTRVGYTGGTTPTASYRHLGDHSEAVEIEYDPDRITYRELLDFFWHSHAPMARPRSRQYRAAVFVHDEEQRRLAIETREAVARELGTRVFTSIEPAGAFHEAEAYHQKYYLQRDPVLYAAIAAAVPDVVRSTAAARVNGILGGYVSAGRLDSVIADLGLAAPARERLVAAASRRLR